MSDPVKPKSPYGAPGITWTLTDSPTILNSKGEPISPLGGAYVSVPISAPMWGSTGYGITGIGNSVGIQLSDAIDTHPKYLALADETRALRKELTDRNSTTQEQRGRIERLTKIQTLGFLLTRVNEEAKAKLLDSDEFAAQFLENPVHDSFVLSVDIRRSTELMLKARSPERFAEFITALCRELTRVVVQSWGVLDKFTGDGILAFYPAFYSGVDAGLLAIAAAEQCHRVFAEQYLRHRHCFKTVLVDVGLGIGIDYGQTHLLRIADGLSVVGEPVVYACRMGDAPAGLTLLNQPAYEVVRERYSAHCLFTETTLALKHEGNTLAYAVSLKGSSLSPATPDWCGVAPGATASDAKGAAGASGTKP